MAISPEEIRKRQAAEELLKAWRFTLVGIGGATIHLSVVWFLIAHWAIPPLMANLVAFLAAFGPSFAGHYRWTFRSNRHWKSALARFQLVTWTAFLVNNLALVALLDLHLLPSALTAVLAACVIPVFTFLAGRLWVFP